MSSTNHYDINTQLCGYRAMSIENRCKTLLKIQVSTYKCNKRLSHEVSKIFKESKD